MATSSIIRNLNDESAFQNYDYSQNLRNLLTAFETDISGSSSNSTTYEELLPIPVKMEISQQANISVLPTVPCLIIENENELQDKLRFRYKSEKGCHGGIKPIIKLINCENPSDIFIKVSLYTADEENPTLHVFELGGKQCKDGVGWEELSEDCIAKFSSLSIYTKKKDEILNIVKTRKKTKYRQQKKRIDDAAIEKEAKAEMKTFNLECGKLCFEALRHKKEAVCDKIFSPTIFNQRSTVASDLKITRLSSCYGKCSGDDEIILLCDKIKKDDIEIHFFEKDENGKIVWESNASFNPADIHHQVAIPFKTPPYKENVERKVFLELFRTSDKKSGEPIPFYYRPDECDTKSLKRKRPNSTEDLSNLQTPQLLSSETATFNEPEYSGMSVGSAMCDIISQAPFLSSETLGSTLDTSQSDWMSLSLSDIFNMELSDSWSFPLSDIDDTAPTNSEKDSELSVEAAGTNLAALTLSSKHCEIFKSKKDDRIQIPIEERMRELKNGIIGILKSQQKYSFWILVPHLMKLEYENQNTLLHLAVLKKSENLILLIRMLEVAPKNLINQKNKFHQTPLHLAVSKRLWKVLRIFLMFGADPNIKNQDGYNCMHLAAKQNLPECLREILTPLIMQQNRKYIPNINTLNHEGYAPLHLSVMNGSKRCIEYLIQAKANLNITDGKCGRTPLHLAYIRKSQLIEYLLSQPDVNRNATDFKGCVPNSYASSSTKSTECCVEISTDDVNFVESNCFKIKEENHISTTENMEEGISSKACIIDERAEMKLCEYLDSNGLWKKLGEYVIDEKELNLIAELDPTPSKTILYQLKKHYKDNYEKELRDIVLGETKLLSVAKFLNMS